MDLPTRAVAPEPGVDKERGRDRAMAWFSPSWSPVGAAESFGRPTHPWACSATGCSRTSWRSNPSGSCKPAPRGTGRSSSPPRFCRRLHWFLLRPSTAGVRRPAFVALRYPGGNAAVRTSFQCHSSLAPSRSQGFVKRGTTRSRVLACRLRTHRKAKAPRQTPGHSVLQTTRAKLMPRNLTRASSGLAAARR